MRFDRLNNMMMAMHMCSMCMMSHAKKNASPDRNAV